MVSIDVVASAPMVASSVVRAVARLVRRRFLYSLYSFLLTCPCAAPFKVDDARIPTQATHVYYLMEALGIGTWWLNDGTLAHRRSIGSYGCL